MSFLHITGLEFSPALSVWSFYIPLLSLYWPFKVVSEIWRASIPISTSVGEDWKLFSIPLIIPVWWVLFILSGIFGGIVNSYFSPHSLTEIKIYLSEWIFMKLILSIVTVLGIMIAYKINENQSIKLDILKKLDVRSLLH